VDRFLVDLHPTGDAFNDCNLVAVGRAIASERYVEKQIAVFTDNIDERVDDSPSRLVRMMVEDTPVVMPVADANVRLPRIRFDDIAATALNIEGHALPSIIGAQSGKALEANGGGTSGNH